MVTAGGIHGKVVSVDEKTVNLEIANGVVIRISKGFVASLEKKE